MSRGRLRAWILAGGRVASGELRDDTPLLDTRIVTSLQLVELILYLEELRGRALDPERLAPGSFRDIDSICRNFLEER